MKKDGELPMELYKIAREKQTEPAFSGKYVHENASGMYICAICGTELFSSTAKFDSGSGWPSFTEPANSKNIKLREDTSGGMVRTEVVCATCGAHLGHLFDDGPKDKGGMRYCVNSLSLELKKEKK